MTTAVLTKSDFLNYQRCAKSFWLKAKKPDAVQWRSPSAFDRLIMKDGYAVEAQAKRLVATWPDAHACSFQRSFNTDNLLARADLVKEQDDGSLEIFEIKGSTSLKSSTGDDHIDDACFQMLVAERAGHQVRAVFVMHTKGDYSRLGEVEPADLLTIVDVTDLARERSSKVMQIIDDALALLGENSIDEQNCDCRTVGSRDKRCVSFAHFNPDVPALSAHLLPRISKRRLAKLDEEGRLAIHDVRSSDVTATQLPVWLALTTGEPVINVEGLRQFLDALSWPLHFYDYETFASAIPLADGHRPHQPIPVQFSLHKLYDDGRLEHHEYLAMQPGLQAELVGALYAAFDNAGSVVVWNQSFETGCNRRMAELLPGSSLFLDDINARTVDLMDLFKADYVHPGFEGSTSIKKVLPILCPHLQYDKKTVHDGAGAMEAWITMVETQDEAVKQRLALELRGYCELDSFAMVEILKKIQDIAHVPQ